MMTRNIVSLLLFVVYLTAAKEAAQTPDEFPSAIPEETIAADKAKAFQRAPSTSSFGTRSQPFLKPIRRPVPLQVSESNRHTEFWGFNHEQPQDDHRPEASEVQFRASQDDRQASTELHESFSQEDRPKPNFSPKFKRPLRKEKPSFAKVRQEESFADATPQAAESEEQSRSTSFTESEENKRTYHVFPYLLIGRTADGNRFPFLAVMKDKNHKAPPSDPFHPAFIAMPVQKKAPSESTPVTATPEPINILKTAAAEPVKQATQVKETLTPPTKQNEGPSIILAPVFNLPSFQDPIQQNLLNTHPANFLRAHPNFDLPQPNQNLQPQDPFLPSLEGQASSPFQGQVSFPSQNPSSIQNQSPSFQGQPPSPFQGQTPFQGQNSSPFQGQAPFQGHNSSPFQGQNSSPFQEQSPFQGQSQFRAQASSPFPVQTSSPFQEQSQFRAQASSPFPVQTSSPFQGQTQFRAQASSLFPVQTSSPFQGQSQFRAQASSPFPVQNSSPFLRQQPSVASGQQQFQLPLFRDQQMSLPSVVMPQLQSQMPTFTFRRRMDKKTDEEKIEDDDED